MASSVYCPKAKLAAVAGLRSKEMLAMRAIVMHCEVCSGLGGVLIGRGEILIIRNKCARAVRLAL